MIYNHTRCKFYLVVVTSSRKTGPFKTRIIGRFTYPDGKENDMKKSKFTEEQIAFALRQAQAGTRVEEVCRKFSISQATVYN